MSMRQGVGVGQGPGVDDPRVIAALEEYAAALEAGKAPDRDAFLARHADVAEALAGCLTGLEFVHDLAHLSTQPRSSAVPILVSASAGPTPIRVVSQAPNIASHCSFERGL